MKRERRLLKMMMWIGVAMLTVAALAKSSDAPKEPAYFKIHFKTITGKKSSLEKFRGKVLLVVNTASKCGHTPQYAGLEKLYEQYKDSGLVVIGFPENNFKNQEPGTNAEIAAFCTQEYGVTFPMMGKINVKGRKIHPLYRYLRTQPDSTYDITWNFNKFLIDRQGKVVARYSEKVEPEDPAIVAKIEKLIREQ
jgi:glutathione peroxidase